MKQRTAQVRPQTNMGTRDELTHGATDLVFQVYSKDAARLILGARLGTRSGHHLAMAAWVLQVGTRRALGNDLKQRPLVGFYFDQGMPIGMVLLEKRFPLVTSQFKNRIGLYVKPSYRRRGIGRMLVEGMLRYARADRRDTYALPGIQGSVRSWAKLGLLCDTSRGAISLDVDESRAIVKLKAGDPQLNAIITSATARHYKELLQAQNLTHLIET